MKNTAEMTFEKTAGSVVVFVKREKIVCPTCGKKIWSDSVEFHKKSQHPWD